MTSSTAPPIPEGALSPVDVYKQGARAAHMWRIGETVSFRYRDDYLATGGTPVAFTLPLSEEVLTNDRMRLPAFFAGLLPEGESRRRFLQRSLRLAEDDELGLLAAIGADTVGDVQVVPRGEPLPSDEVSAAARDWEQVSFRELWLEIPERGKRSALPGVQPKMSAHSRSLAGGSGRPVILKFALEEWRGALHNERFFMQHAAAVGLEAPTVSVVTDREGDQALEEVRFDRTVSSGRLRRHAQEDGSQVLGIRPGQKYDVSAREIITALAGRCASPPVAVRDLFHQLAYSYAIGNNDVHAKNLSVREDPESGLWTVSPVYDVLHTWPYEADHRFYPPIREDGPHDAVTRRHWLALARDVGLPERAAHRIIEQVSAGVLAVLGDAREEIEMPDAWLRDLERRIEQRVRYLEAG
ncbi:MAG: HipA domain-containing protein [Nitriliruptorales bacterium]|nr:HipA domain-containing protein [Nitriliruptorales bacterium]